MFTRGFRTPGGFPGGPGYGYGMRPRGFGGHAFFPLGGIIPILVALVVTGVVVFALWRIFRKAGFEGAFSLVALVPFIGVPIALLFLAFADWPVFARFRTEPVVAYAPPVAPVTPAPEAPVAPADAAPTAPIEPAPAPEDKPAGE